MNRPRLNALVKLEYNSRKPSVWDYDSKGNPLFFNTSTEKQLIKSSISSELETNRHYFLDTYSLMDKKSYYVYKKKKAYSTAEPTWSKYHYKRHKKIRGKKRYYNIMNDKIKYTKEWEEDNKK